MIYDRIMQKIIEFEADNGNEPSNVYLGASEWMELKKHAYDTVGYSYSEAGGNEVVGKKIYLVGEQFHLAVA